MADLLHTILMKIIVSPIAFHESHELVYIYNIGQVAIAIHSSIDKAKLTHGLASLPTSYSSGNFKVAPK